MDAWSDELETMLAEGRIADAERELARRLREEPGDAQGHGLRALCLLDLGRVGAADAASSRAVELEDGSAQLHWIRGMVLLQKKDLTAAAASAARAAELDPTDAEYPLLLARCEAGAGRWSSALDAAERGLLVEPAHGGCARFKALALERLGRTAEADAAFQEVLSSDEHDPFAHTGRGWAILRQGHGAREAVPHFGKALRADPESEWAREGMIAALKARNPVYRWLLRYFLWMSGLPPRTRMMIVFGGLIGYNILRRIGDARPELAPAVVPLLAAYLFVVFLSWTADPLFDLLLRFDPVGRRWLTPERRIASTWVAGSLVVAVVAAVAGLATGSGTLLFFALCALFFVVPITATFHAPEGWSRTVMGGASAAIATLALTGLLLDEPTGSSLLGFSALGSILASWVGSALAARR